MEEKDEVKAEEGKKEEVAEQPAEEESVVESIEKELEEEEPEAAKESPEEKVEGEEKPAKTEEGAQEEKHPEEKEEAKEKKPREKKAEEEEIVEEKTYTVPLSKAWIMPANKRAARSMRILKAYVVKHMKMNAPKEGEEGEEEEPASLIITNEVNERIWSRGIEKPPRNIRVRAAKDKDGNVTVHLAEGD
jgi:large subunit ribosomal protein L31e